MDPSMKTKAIGAGVLLACVMALALTNKITGGQAIQALEALGAAFFGATALLGSAHVLSNAMVARTTIMTAAAKPTQEKS